MLPTVLLLYEQSQQVQTFTEVLKALLEPSWKKSKGWSEAKDVIFKQNTNMQ